MTTCPRCGSLDPAIRRQTSPVELCDGAWHDRDLKTTVVSKIIPQDEKTASELLKDLSIEIQGALFVNEKQIRVAIGNRHYDSLMEHIARAKDFLMPKVGR